MKQYRFAVHNMVTDHSFWFYKRFRSAYDADRWAMRLTFRTKANTLYNIIPTFD